MSIQKGNNLENWEDWDFDDENTSSSTQINITEQQKIAERKLVEDADIKLSKDLLGSEEEKIENPTEKIDNPSKKIDNPSKKIEKPTNKKLIDKKTKPVSRIDSVAKSIKNQKIRNNEHSDRFGVASYDEFDEYNDDKYYN